MKLPHYVDFQSELELLRKMRSSAMSRGQDRSRRSSPGETGGILAYNFAYLDEQTKRMIRRALLKGRRDPRLPGALRESREMPMPYGWGTGGVQVTCGDYR